MDISSIMKFPVVVGEYVHVKDGSGRVVNTHDRLKLAKDYFIMTNEGFYNAYGFNLVPEEPYYSQAKRLVEKQAEDSRYNWF